MKAEHSKKKEQIWTREAILDALARHRNKLERMGVQRIGLFCSYVRDEAGPHSDNDILVTFDSPSFDAYTETKFHLEGLFGCKVDLVLEKSLKPRLRSGILAEVVYAA